MKKLSAGFIIDTPDGILMCHPTGFKVSDGNYDIPKGEVDGLTDYQHKEKWSYDEIYDFLGNALRELREETGMLYYYDYNKNENNDSLEQNFTLFAANAVFPYIMTGKFMGVYKYRSDKDLAVFYMHTDSEIPSEYLKCTSFFTPKEGLWEGQPDIPETRGYRWNGWCGGPVPEVNGYIVSKDLNMLFPKLQSIVKDVLSKINKEKV